MVKSAKNFGVGNSSSVHIDNNKNDIIILHKGRTQVLNDSTIAVEAEYSTDFSRSRKKIVSVCIIMEATLFYLLMRQRYNNSKQKTLKKIYSLCLGNISKEFAVNNMKNRGLKG